MATLKDHLTCMHTHEITSFPILMGEIQCFRAVPKWAHLLPPVEVGNIRILRCPEYRGTIIRVEVMNDVCDYSLPQLASHYYIVTGPSPKGFIVGVYLRTSHGCDLIIFLIEVSSEGDTKIGAHHLSNNQASDVHPLRHTIEDGGDFVSRTSFMGDTSDQKSIYYELMDNINTWNTVYKRQTRIFRHSDPATMPRYCPTLSRDSTFMFETFQVMLNCNQLRFEDQVTYDKKMKRLVRTFTDQIWLTPTYGFVTTIHPKQQVTCRVEQVIKDNGCYEFFNKHHIFTEVNDPDLAQLRRLCLYQRVHNKNGSIAEVPRHESHWSQDTTSYHITFAPREKELKPPRPAAWKPAIRETRQRDWFIPTKNDPGVRLDESENDYSPYEIGGKEEERIHGKG